MTAGFTQLNYTTLNTDSLPTIAAIRHDGPPTPLAAGQPLCTFQR
jgi:hypothetical protein